MIPRLIVDAHLDIALNYVAFGRDFRDSSTTKHHKEGKYPYQRYPFDHIGVATVGLPDLILGRTAIVFASLWAAPQGSSGCPETVYYETPRQAYQVALRQLDYYHRLQDEDERIRLIRNQSELQTILDSWSPDRDLTQHKLGLVVQMEGADPVLEPKQVEEWFERGVRILAPAWHATRYSAGTGNAGRLTKLGQELLEIMSSFGMILDISHLAEAACREALDIYEGVIIATHSNPFHFIPTDRHLADDTIRQLAERGGVMGIVPYNEFLSDGWKSGQDSKAQVSVVQVLDMIDHVCQITGTAEHVGLGTDWDGTFGWESIPFPFDSHIDLWKIGSYLEKRGYAPQDIDNILGHNFIRVLQRAL